MIVGSRTGDIKSLWFRWGQALISFSAMVEELGGAYKKRPILVMWCHDGPKCREMVNTDMIASCAV